MGREYDVLVYGATGFTGQLVAKQLASVQPPLRFAIAGRSQAKLKALSGKLSIDGRNVGSFVADAAESKPDALAQLCAKATLVIACAGPFSAVGMPVVDACVAAGTHYVDITGEFTFVSKVVEKHHAAAMRKDIFVVPCAGFDCVAADVANHYTHRLAEQKGATLQSVESAYALKGGFSRGTMESIAYLIQTATPAALHPFSLLPREARKGRLLPPRGAADAVKPHAVYAGKYTAPFMMGPVNERVVRRSDFLNGRNAAYHEVLLGTWRQCQSARLQGALLLASRNSLGMWLLRTFVFPSTGGGPTAAEREAGGFSIRTLGYLDKQAKTKAVVQANVAFRKDPYTFTAISVVETATTILNNETETKMRGGVVTPAALAGDAITRRLQKQGLKLRSKL